MEIINCKVCGRDFEWTDGEQEFYYNRSLDPPKRCPECRAKKRRESGSEIERLKAEINELKGIQKRL